MPLAGIRSSCKKKGLCVKVPAIDFHYVFFTVQEFDSLDALNGDNAQECNQLGKGSIVDCHTDFQKVKFC